MPSDGPDWSRTFFPRGIKFFAVRSVLLGEQNFQRELKPSSGDDGFTTATGLE